MMMRRHYDADTLLQLPPLPRIERHMREFIYWPGRDKRRLLAHAQAYLQY